MNGKKLALTRITTTSDSKLAINKYQVSFNLSKVKLKFTNQFACQFSLNARFLKKGAQPYKGFKKNLGVFPILRFRIFRYLIPVILIDNMFAINCLQSSLKNINCRVKGHIGNPNGI